MPKQKRPRRAAVKPDVYKEVVCYLDPSKKNFALWAGRLKRPEERTNRPGECLIKDLAMDKFALPKSGNREIFILQELQKRLGPRLFDAITFWDSEAQNPTAEFAPGTKRKFAGNAAAFAISKATMACIHAHRQARGLPEVKTQFSAPRSKFFSLGLSCPGKKSVRKQKAVRVQRAFFRVHRDDPGYDMWRERLENFRDPRTDKIKLDDVSDVRLGGISRLLRLAAGLK